MHQSLPDDANVLRVDHSVFHILDELAPGLLGYTVEHENTLHVPLVVAEDPGHGALSRYLDALPKNKTIKFPVVVSSILVGALLRRGFVVVREYSEIHHEHVPVYVRHAL